MSARVRPGHDATVINVSRFGLLIETACRLLPGSRVELHLHRRHTRITTCGRVLRACVADVAADAMRYHSAVAFDQPLYWPPDVSEHRAGRSRA